MGGLLDEWKKCQDHWTQRVALSDSCSSWNQFTGVIPHGTSSGTLPVQHLYQYNLEEERECTSSGLERCQVEGWRAAVQSVWDRLEKRAGNKLVKSIQDKFKDLHLEQTNSLWWYRPRLAGYSFSGKGLGVLRESEVDVAGSAPW